MNTQQTGAMSEIQDFFFEATLATYASGEKAKTDPNNTNLKFYSFQRRDYLYLDKFMVNGEHSGGQTVISFQGKPVWLMQYHGWCKDDDPFAFSEEVNLRTRLSMSLVTFSSERVLAASTDSRVFASPLRIACKYCNAHSLNLSEISSCSSTLSL